MVVVGIKESVGRSTLLPTTIILDYMRCLIHLLAGGVCPGFD